MPLHLGLARAALGVIILSHTVACFYTTGGDVVNLTPSNFDGKLRSGAWLVEFYAPWCGHCKSLKPAWEQAAKGLKGIVNVGAVDSSEDNSLAGQYNVQGFPTIKFMYAKSNGEIKAVDYQGGRDAASLISFAMDKARALALKRIGKKAESANKPSAGRPSGGGGGDDGFYSGTDVVVLSAGNFKEQVTSSEDLWLVEFYAPWCGHCKQLKPVWEDAASQLKGKVRLGAVDCTVHEQVCGQFNVRGYPTIKFFGANKHSPEDYEGGRDSGSIVSFASGRWASQAPPPEVVQLTSQATFEEQCLSPSGSPKQLCFVAFLPNILDSGAKGRNKYISVLKKVADKYKDRPFSYLWLEGGSQEGLEKNFGVGGFGYPALIAFNADKASFSTCREAFEFEHITNWVERIRRSAGESVVAIRGEVASVSLQAPWDGKDAKVEVEDEFSLDDIMNDEE